MCRHRIAVVLFVCLAFAVSGVAAARPYFVTNLGNLFGSGAGTCDALAVNTVGGQLEIVGNSQGTDLAIHPWYWTQASGMVNLDAKLASDLGATSASVSGVNASGRIVGLYNGNYGFSYTIGGTATSMVLPGSTGGSNPTNWWLTVVGNVTDGGITTGYGGIGIDPTSRPYLYNFNTNTLTEISTASGATARVINNNGWVAGNANEPSAPSTAHVWNTSTWTDLGVPSSSYIKGSTALAMNNSADVAGLVGYDSATQGHACYSHYNGSSWDTMVDIGNLSAYNSAYVHARAQGINDSRQIVGYSWPSIRQYSTDYAFLAGTTAGSAVALNTLIPAADQANWRLCTAFAIDNAGNIVGGGLYNGIANAYLMRPAMDGDANLDGKVDIGDLSVVLANYDKTGMSWSQGDFDGNGGVDISDLSKILANYDKSMTAAAGLTPVPEPSTLLLAFAGLMGLVAYAWRKRK